MRRIIVYLAASIINAIIFMISSEYCLAVRGKSAVGGEYLFAIAAVAFAVAAIYMLAIKSEKSD